MFANKNYVLILTSALLLFNGLGHAAVEIKNATQAKKYLTQFGYYSPITLDPNSIHLLEKESLRNALLDFQSFAGIKETGVLDQETLELMNTPRCGCLDRFYRTRPKRYGHLLETWRVDNLTYKISRYPSKQLSKEQTDLEFRKAFDVWSEVMPIVFHERDTGPVRIDISFVNGEHGDLIPFDGPSGVIVHNLSPSRGSVHFDDAEIWTVGIRKGINLFQVALHIIGHVLGLDHSLDVNAAMRPFYKSYNPNVELHADDILGVQEMYGPRVDLDDNDDETNFNANGATSAYLCSNPRIDTIFNSLSNETFVLKGNYYWSLSPQRILHGHPKFINQTWPGLPKSIDAAFTYKGNGHTYFFKNSYYWKYSGTTMLDGYPKSIKNGFAGIPNDIDAVLPWENNERLIYFFKGQDYWIYNVSATPPVSYPKRIDQLLGVLGDLDATLAHTNQRIYVFKGHDFYQFSDFSFGSSNESPPPPKKIAKYWFGCGPNNANNDY